MANNAEAEAVLLERAIADAKVAAGTKEPETAPPAEAAAPPAGTPPVQNQPSALADMEARYIAAQNDMQTKLWESMQRAKEAEARAKALEEKSFNDPYEAFKRLGGSFDELAEREINEGSPSVEHTIKEIKAQLQKERQWRKDREAREQQQTIAQQRQQQVMGAASDMLREVRAAGNDYADVGALLDFVSEITGADPQQFLAGKIAPVMEKIYKDTGRQLTPIELLSNLQAESSGFLEKMRTSKALRGLLGESQAAEQAAAETLPAENKPEIPKALNQDQSAAPEQLPEGIDSMSNSRLYQLVDQLARK